MFYPKDRNFTWILICCEGSLALHFWIVSFNWSLLILYTTEGVPERKHHPIISLYYLWYKRECIHTHAFTSFFFNVQLAMPCGKKVMNYITRKSKLPRLFFLVPDDVRWAICYHLSTLSLMFLWQVTQCILEQANLMFPYSHSDLWTQVTKVTQYALLLDCLRFQPLCKNKVQAQMLGYSAMVSVSGS